MAEITCSQCFQQLPHHAGDKIFRNDECPNCSASLHTCKMCNHYDSNSYNECREPVAERVVDKEKANFCDFFRLHNNQSQGEDKKDLLDAATKIFKE